MVTNFAAMGHIFQRLLTDDWLWCIQMCFSDSRCVSYNFHKQSSTCELNDCGIDICGDQNEELVFSSGCVYPGLKHSPFGRVTLKMHSPGSVFTRSKVYPPPPPPISPTNLVIFQFYYLIPLQIYFNTERLLK